MRLPMLLPMLLALAAGTSLAQPSASSDDPQFVIRNLEVLNSPKDEYSPYVTPDGVWLYFTSARGEGSDLYRSKWSSAGWTSPEHPAIPDVNTIHDDGAFYAPIPAMAEMFSIDEDMMERLNVPKMGVITAGGRKDALGSADLYILDVSRNTLGLSGVRPFSSLNTIDWEAQATIAPDGSFIIFSSDRPDHPEGTDGMDLYMVARESDGSYSSPVNLGLPVNTEGNDFAPFIASDGHTLFFASTGHKGFGGADIFRTTLLDDGTWSMPENLGNTINTSANEQFFFGIGRERCYFVSDRSGGKGGLDLYEAKPNIFAVGYAPVQVRIMDTTAGKPVRGRLKVVESSLGKTVTEMEIPEEGAALALFASAGYRLEIAPAGFPAATRTLARLQTNRRSELTLNVGTPPLQPQPEFVFELEDPVVNNPGINPIGTNPNSPAGARVAGANNVDLRLFVSGYYRINTPVHLQELRQKQESGELKRQRYIANVAANDSVYAGYQRQAEQVDRILDKFYRRAVEEYFPAYLTGKKPDEHLEIVVYGYADPRPITGTYMEQPVTFFSTAGEEVTVKNGESLNNFKLAGLRAYYTVQFLDRLFREAAAKGYPQYKTLMDKGMIRWRPVSGDVDASSSEDLSQSRRVKLDFRRVSSDGTQLR